MLYKAVCSTLLLTSILHADCCGPLPHPMRVTLRDIQNGGVGYNQGYTSLDLFLAPSDTDASVVPFLDVRGHVFNNGRGAANAGLGVRFISDCVWGINTYYDYRQTKHKNYNQFSIGFEALGEYVDFRLNAYVPFGKKSKSPLQATFEEFIGNSMFISYKREAALRGLNAEFGFHIDTLENIPFYIAAGPYYLTNSQDTTWGGEARLAIDFYEYFRAEGNVSYDHLFKWIGQGQLSVNLPFGKRCPVKKRANQCCSTTLSLRRRALQRVDRNEIIAVNKKKTTVVAYNPLTGNPFTFVFVDNTSSSLGTFESPVPTLAEAEALSSPYDIIYAFPGDGTSTGMDSGLTLKDNQMLLGSSLAYPFETQVGTVTVPAFTETMPFITNSGGAAITAVSNNTISGLHVGDSLPGILATGIDNLTISNNQFTTSIIQDAVNITDVTGTLSITHNSFVSDSAPYTAIPIDTYSNGVIVNNANGSAKLFVVGNFFNNHGGYGLGITLNQEAKADVYITDNTVLGAVGFEYPLSIAFPGISPSAIGIVVFSRGNSTCTSSILNNTCQYQEAGGIMVAAAESSSCFPLVQNNVVMPGLLVPVSGDIAGFGIVLETFQNSVMKGTITENIVTTTKTAGLGYAHFSLQYGSVNITKNHVTGGGVAPGGTLFGAGITIANEALGSDAGSMSAFVADNVCLDCEGYGGILFLNLPIFQNIGSMCIEFVNNVSNTNYSIYNVSTESGKIFLEEGYQSNIGPIDFSPPPPQGFFPINGGPVDIVPLNTCSKG